MHACGIDTSKETSNVNSKWVYSKELLADESDAKLIEIADELDIQHGYVAKVGVSAADSKFWKSGYFRLFLSHLAAHKVKASMLQNALLPLGISSFVAHEDIEPTKEWLLEIEKALLSMDALAAILTPGFKESNWTDQEVGFAVGRDVLVVPIRRGLDPYGFVARYQGLQSKNLSVRQVAEETHHIISTNPKTKGKYSEVVVKLVLEAKDKRQALHWLEILETIESVPTPSLEHLQSNGSANALIGAHPGLLERINRLLSSAGVSEIVIQPVATTEFDDDIPF